MPLPQSTASQAWPQPWDRSGHQKPLTATVLTQQCVWNRKNPSRVPGLSISSDALAAGTSGLCPGPLSRDSCVTSLLAALAQKPGTTPALGCPERSPPVLTPSRTSLADAVRASSRFLLPGGAAARLVTAAWGGRELQVYSAHTRRIMSVTPVLCKAKGYFS